MCARQMRPGVKETKALISHSKRREDKNRFVGFFFLRYYIIYQVVLRVEKAMAPHSSTLAWKIPWTEEPDGL